MGLRPCFPPASSFTFVTHCSPHAVARFGAVYRLGVRFDEGWLTDDGSIFAKYARWLPIWLAH